MRTKEVRQDEVIRTAGALASETRMDILRLLAHNPLSVTDIAETLGMPISSAISAVLKLESADLITSAMQGTKKICQVNFDSVMLNITAQDHSDTDFPESVSYSIPIGDYCAFSAQPSCGILGDGTMIGTIDEASAFHSPDKAHARLIWLRKGHLEYRIRQPLKQGQRIKNLSICMELCSEYPGFNNAFPSETRLSVNNIDIGPFHTEGDFGGRRGIYTPAWWPESSTQYGKLATWAITEGGSFINAERCSAVTTADLHLEENEFITFRISVEGNGGFNLFSKGFGDYNQDIEVRIDMESEAT